MNWWVHIRFMKWNVKTRIFINTHLLRALLNRSIYKLISCGLFRTALYSHYFKFCNFFKTHVCCGFLSTATFALFPFPNSFMLFSAAFNKNRSKCCAADKIFSTSECINWNSYVTLDLEYKFSLYNLLWWLNIHNMLLLWFSRYALFAWVYVKFYTNINFGGKY